MSDGSNASFTIAPDEFYIFLDSTIIDEPLVTYLPDEIEEANESVLYGYESTSGTYAQELIVDISDNERWIVYFTIIAGG